VKRRDEIISQLQNRIQELEVGHYLLNWKHLIHISCICFQGSPITNGCSDDKRQLALRRIVRGGSSEEGDISDQEETFSDQPFMVKI